MSVDTGVPAAEAEQQESADSRHSAWPAIRKALSANGRAIAVLTAVAAAAAFLATVYLVDYRADQQTNAAGRAEAIDAASAGTAALLSYAPETIESDLETSRSLMTGEFLTYYSKFTADVVAPAVRKRGVTANAHVARAALMDLHPDRAKVLLFLNQETSSRDRPEPAPTASSVIVSMTKVDGK